MCACESCEKASESLRKGKQDGTVYTVMHNIRFLNRFLWFRCLLQMVARAGDVRARDCWIIDLSKCPTHPH
jgi:hypothetical protein